MLPSRGLARVGPGALSRNQIIVTPAFRTSVGRSRQFGTTLKSNGKPLTQSSRLGLVSGSRVDAATLLSSPTFSLASTRRFASTGSESQSSPWAAPTPSSNSSPDFSLDALDSSLNDIPQKVGYLAELGLDYGWGPTSICEWTLEHLHFTMDLSWGWSIVGVAAILRAATFYPALMAQQESHKMQELRKDPVYEELSMAMLNGVRTGGAGSQETMMIKMQMKMLEKEAGIQRSRLFYPLLQLPFALGMFKLTRSMAALPVPGMETQGFAWFTDLTMHDPFFVLPCVSTVMLVLSIRRNMGNSPPGTGAIMKILPWVLGPITILFTLKMSAAVTLYIACASLTQYLQSTIFFMPRVRALTGLPPLPPRNTASHRTVSSSKNATYQAPRTINTTARPTTDNTSTNGGLFSELKDARSSIKQTFDRYVGSESKGRKKYSDQYEQRRRKEEAEKFLARREAANKRKK